MHASSATRISRLAGLDRLSHLPRYSNATSRVVKNKLRTSRDDVAVGGRHVAWGLPVVPDGSYRLPGDAFPFVIETAHDSRHRVTIRSSAAVSFIPIAHRDGRPWCDRISPPYSRYKEVVIWRKYRSERKLQVNVAPARLANSPPESILTLSTPAEKSPKFRSKIPQPS